MQVRRGLQQLLKAHILFGSIERGVSVHDLVRDCMIRLADAHEGGLCGLQREAVPLLLDAIEGDGPAASYVASRLYWHVRQAQLPETELHSDALMMRVLAHEAGAVRKQVNPHARMRSGRRT